MTAAELTLFFEALDHFFAGSGRLLLNAAALVCLLVARSPLPTRLRIECEFPRYGKVEREDRCYLGEFLEPCERTQRHEQEPVSPDPHMDHIDGRSPSADLPLDANTPRGKTQGHCKSLFNRPKTEASNIRTTILKLR